MQTLEFNLEEVVDLNNIDAASIDGGRSVKTWVTEAVVGVAFGLVGIAVFEYYYNN